MGRTGLKVSRLCLGTNMFGAGYVDDKRAVSVVNEAYERGVNFIDTADAYHSGLSEHVVGKAVKARRNEFIIGTKGFVATSSRVNDMGLSGKHVIDAVEGSLRRLDTDYIDLYQVHYWDPETPLEETLRTLDDLVRQGKIRYLGCSNFAAWQVCRALWVSDKMGLERCESVQPEYNFRRREIEGELVALCQDQRVAINPYQLFMAGILTGDYKRQSEPPEDSHMTSRHAQRAKETHWTDATFDMVERLRAISDEVGKEPSQVGLAWALAKPGITSVIVGSSRPEQVVQNAEAVDIKLPLDILEQLDRL